MALSPSSGDLADGSGHHEVETAISEPYNGNAPNLSNTVFEMSQLPSSTQDEPREADAAEGESRSNWRIVAIMLALSLSLFISALDQTIVATATPTISAELHSGRGYVWIGGAYLIANAASSNIWANLSDIWGRKPILLLAVALFFGASIICAKAINMPMLIAGRGVQGIAGGGLIQLITITISDLFSVRLRSLFLGLIEFIWAIAGALGPIVGGAFTQSVSWRWIFWINLPVCGTAFVLLLLFLDVHNPKTGVIDGIKAVDWFGSFSILGLAVMVLLGLDFGGDTFPWNSPKVICLIVFGCLMSLIFIYSEKRLAKYPLMPLGVFKSRSNVACFIVAFTHGFAFLGQEYYLPLFFQSAKEASPFHSGLLILPFVLSEAALSLAAGIIIHRTGHYLEIVWTGTALVLLGSGLFIDFGAMSPLAKIICYQVVAGAGCGLLFFPPLLALQSNVPQDETAAATATFGFIRNMAMAMSVVLGGVVFQNSMDTRQSELLAAGLSDSIVKELTGPEAAANIMVIQSIEDTFQRSVVKDAYAWSLRNIWILYASLSACGLLFSLLITRQHLSKEHIETKTGLKEKEPHTESQESQPVSAP
ncbi:MDR family MFS transporter [Aspergillus alliaceus]|uniref:MDR family MFS transporter n=1 Tax=Petromyces alliaceus TaxID=209559 RepID=UPI0012A67A57|nr:major facilitator superfamily domain-containing protein [Aspergillus alliaceus]KAB8232664.1 major facilitator superfamily domain-containing protein [Aspergillus alliaceus]